MQTTLLGLAIAIILALVAALVGPLLIDWGPYRSVFEAEASHLIGVDMRVTGAIEARLLPSPRLTLRDVEIGEGADTVGARALTIEFALGPLMRGQWHASELHLRGARLHLGLDAAGRLKAPNIPINFSPEALSIDRLSVEDARLTLADARNGGEIVLDKIWFNGEARSLVGPFSGEGAATEGGELYPFRISTGRVNDDGVKVHLNVDPVMHPLSIEADGALAFSGAAPSFDGSLKLARPVGIASPQAAAVSQPWRVSGKIKVGATSALMPQLEFQYGSADQGFKLTGTADFKFGSKPRFDGVLSGRQIDLDRVLAVAPGASPPVSAVRALTAAVAGDFHPAVPVRLGIGIDRVTLGGGALEDVRGDISSNSSGWSLDRFAFQAPGFTQVRLSGELAAGGLGFKGPAEIDAGDPKILAAWIEGRAAPQHSAMKPLRLRGDIALSSERLAVERLSAGFERKPLTGSLRYDFAADQRPARLEATLSAPELDVDAALAFAKALAAGSDLPRPRQLAIDASIGEAHFAGIDARDVEARVQVDGDSLKVDRIAATDLGGNAFSASGRIDAGEAPHGLLTLDLDAPRPAAVATLAGKIWPDASGFAAALERLGHAKLHASLDVSGNKPGSTKARLVLGGDFGAVHLDASAQASGDWNNLSAADVQLRARLAAPEGRTLLQLTALDRLAASGSGPGEVSVELAGPANGVLAGSWRVAAGDVALGSHVAVSGRRVTLSGLEGKLDGSSVRGELIFDGASHIDGTLAADTVDAASLLGSTVGTPAFVAATDGGWKLPSTAFSGGLLGMLTGEIALTAQRADLAPRLILRQFHTRLHFAKDAVSFDDIGGEVAGGRLTGRLALQASDGGLAARGRLELSSADAAALLPAAARPPIGGTLDVAADVEGSGFSPAALIGSLHGTGKVALRDGYLAALDAGVIDSVTRAVDNGLAPDIAHVADVAGKALQGGRFPVRRAEGEIAISAGQARLADTQVEADEARLAIGGNVDLTDGAIDARLTLSGPEQPGAGRPVIFVSLNGPLASPERSIDVSALSGWLTLRAIDKESRRLKAIESAAQAVPPAKINEAPARPAPLNIKPPVARSAPAASFGAQH